jgi:hypothetical protein
MDASQISGAEFRQSGSRLQFPMPAPAVFAFPVGKLAAMEREHGIARILSKRLEILQSKNSNRHMTNNHRGGFAIRNQATTTWPLTTVIPCAASFLRLTIRREMDDCCRYGGRIVQP